MKNFLPVLMMALPIILSSCDKSYEPAKRDKYRISFIYSGDNNHADAIYQIFEYNRQGLATRWEYSDSGDSYTATYEYTADDLIEIKSDKVVSGTNTTWVFNENLYLNSDGTATHADGIVTIYQNDLILIKKHYTADFTYNLHNQLASIRIAEKRTNDSGWEDTYSLNWSAELEWTDGNLTTYSEYYNSPEPRITYKYTYYDEQMPDFSPIVQASILRAYYLPLQYQGVFGKQSIGLVKTAS